MCLFLARTAHAKRSLIFVSETDPKAFIPVPPEVMQEAELGNLIMFVGSGVSRRLNLPSWDGLAKSVLNDLEVEGKIECKDVQLLRKLDARKILSISKILNQELDFAPYFEPPNDTESDIYETLNSIGCTFVTTNYDKCLKPSFMPSNGDSITRRLGERISSCDMLSSSLLDEPGNVVHLHGVYDRPGTMIYAMKDYLRHYDDPSVNTFLKDLFDNKTVVFIGYGLNESELLEHILRRGGAKRLSHQRTLFKLQGFPSHRSGQYKFLRRYYEDSFGIHLLGFLSVDEKYSNLDQIIKTWANRITVKTTPFLHDADAFYRVLNK